MSDPNRTDNNSLPEAASPEEGIREPFVPSPVSKRIWAWMGIVYVVIVMLLITYWIATTSFISGITGIMIFPFLGALCAQGINNYFLAKEGKHGGNPTTLLVTAIIMGFVALSSLIWGILQLLRLSL